jgi:hypothetical protein
MPLYKVTLTKKRRTYDALYYNTEVEHYDANGYDDVLAQLYTRYAKDKISEVFIEPLGGNSKASSEHGTGETQGAILGDG